MKKKNENALSKPTAEVRDGINAENKAEVSNPPSGEEKSFDAESEKKSAAEFEELISGKYKKQFSEKVQAILSRRLKEVKDLKEKAQENAAIVDMLMKKFNIEDGDTQKLERMIDENMNFAEKKTDTENRDFAENNTGMKHIELIKRLIAENNFLKRDRETNMRSMEAKNRAQQWRMQAEETKRLYPEFDFERELSNPEFCRLLKAGVSVKSAYEVLNIDTILDSNSRNAEKKVVDSIRYKKNRPVENGSEPNGGILLSNNIGKLTKKQRAELARRAAGGERIEF